MGMVETDASDRSVIMCAASSGYRFLATAGPQKT